MHLCGDYVKVKSIEEITESISYDNTMTYVSLGMKNSQTLTTINKHAV